MGGDGVAMGADRDRAESRRLLALGLLCSTQFMDIVNLSSVNVALPAINADLGFGGAGLQWVISACALTFAGFLLVGGRVADLFGRRRVLAFGFGVFALSALACALALGPAMLVAARACQGIGAAVTIPASLAILSTTFAAPAERSRALAAFAAAGAVGFAAGLVLGGAVTVTLGWRRVFGLNLPVLAAMLVLTPVLLAPDPQDARTHRRRIDVAGAATATAGLLLLAFGLTRAGEEPGWRAPTAWGALAAAMLLLALFVALQARAREPLMPLRIWRVPSFAPVMAVALLFYAAWTGVTFFAALTLERVLGYGPGRASLAMLPYAVGGYVASTIAGRLLPRVGLKPVLLAGLALYGCGIALTGTIGAGTPCVPRIFLARSTTVFGLGLTFVSANVAALADADPNEHGLVGGLFNTGLQVGGGIGLALLTALAAGRVPAGTVAGAALLPAYRAAFLGAASFVALAFLVALVLTRTRNAAAGTPQQVAPGSKA